MRTLAQVSILAASLLLMSCEKPKYDAFVYPRKYDLFNNTFIGTYDSFEACRDASLKEIRRLKVEGVGFYQCGINCTNKYGLKSVAACKQIIKINDRNK